MGRHTKQETESGALQKLWAFVKDVFAVGTPDDDCDAVWESETWNEGDW